MIKRKDGGFTIEKECSVGQMVDEKNGRVTAFINLPPLWMIPSPFLEDVFHEVSQELAQRDQVEVEELERQIVRYELERKKI